MTTINGYHAHVYFDAETVECARAVCRAASDKFAVTMGRVHEKCVGPHPMWSCQLGFAPEVFDQVIPWLALNRDGLIVFVHPDTGEHLPDHRDRAIWMGGYLPLKLEIFD